METKTLRLILGDQLNSNHSWYETTDNSITYVMMEIRTETDYAIHHIQKQQDSLQKYASFAIT
ncbi:cryptochrome/photolyase family protein [Flavobacterium sp. MR2016-29]|uniref:cryptochrome/photolyase family protein n=1 Tax=Flavobacterium sp. MR2016-29 TaxID=2783795 RepID=UPI001E5AAE05|nr:cryptochrome/photolyase family protein [Flavobacterium sp. MR2016-29]